LSGGKCLETFKNLGMGYILRNCNNCGEAYKADERNLKRGWGLCCSKSCAASLREKSRLDYDPVKVKRNNERRANWNNPHEMPESVKRNLNWKRFGCYAPNTVEGSGLVTGITSEGYRVMDGTAYDEFDDTFYDVDGVDEDERGWDSHK
jgi:hypothetical protein